jgi:glycosyltransferase involved in cell wall biosynthesis
MLLPLIAAAQELSDVSVHLWGDGPQRAVVEQASDRLLNVHYRGWLPPSELPLHFRTADVIYYCLRLDYPGAVYNAPNTLAQAMAAARPVIANEVGDLGRIVRATQCGVLIDEATPQAIVCAIDQLRTSATRHVLGTNGLKAAQNTYNAAALQQQLIDLYDTILG